MLCNILKETDARIQNSAYEIIQTENVLFDKILLIRNN